MGSYLTIYRALHQWRGQRSCRVYRNSAVPQSTISDTIHTKHYTIDSARDPDTRCQMHTLSADICCRVPPPPTYLIFNSRTKLYVIYFKMISSVTIYNVDKSTEKYLSFYMNPL